MSNKRNSKNKHLAPPSQDFFALGANPSTSSSSQLTQSLSKLPTKRNESFQTPMSMSPKRPKLNSPLPQTGPMLGSQSIPSQMPKISNMPVSKSWEERSIIVPAAELKDKILQYDSESDSEDMIERLLCGAAKQLREQRNKPDSCLVFTLIYLAKIRPLFFCSNIIVEAFSSLLKRDTSNQFKTKNSLVPVLVINLFHYAFHDENSWPEIFLNMFIEDSLGDRIWVDNDECKDFVDIIIASFKTKLPPKSLLQTTDVLNPPKHADSSPVVLASLGEDSLGDEASCSSNSSAFYDQSKDANTGSLVSSRYTDNEAYVINYVSEVINEQLNRRQSISDISRNMLKLLMATSGIRNVRLIVAQKLELWLQNPKISRPAQDLLLTLCLNCNENDTETLSHLMKMRLKNKAFVNHFILCLKELLNQKNATFDNVLRTVLSNELSQTRNLNNFQLISIIFQHSPDRATVVLAQFFHSMIFQKDDFLRALRILLREIVRVLRHEPLNYVRFVNTLLEESKYFSEKIEFINLDPVIKERAVQTIIDLVAVTILLSFNPNVREAFSTSKSDRREIIRNFQIKIADVQCRAVKWLHETVIKKYCAERKNFCYCLNKVLFLEHADQYCKIDNWPPENERNFVFRLTSEVPLFEETLLTILCMGASKEIPLTPQESCEISCTLINRAALIYEGDPNYPVLLLHDVSIIQRLFDSCAYICPENTVFPQGYIPPNMAIIDLYWKVWLQILILVSHIPSVFGEFAWKNFPTFRMLIEMVITNNYQYPPISHISDDLINKELQLSQLEKVKILEFENYLASNREITENNSYLLSTLISLNPTSIPRRPPTQVLEQLKVLCNNANSPRLCHLLCQSRKPDFLLMIIEQQQNCLGPQTFFTPMTWLVELVESNENNFGMLPVQCLCEYILGQIAEEVLSISAMKSDKFKKKEKRRRQIRLIAHFQNIIQQNTSENLTEIFEYLLRRLSFTQSATRQLAYKALYLIVSTNCEEYLSKLDENNVLNLMPVETSDWLKNRFIKYLKSDLQIQSVSQALENALVVESNPALICDYFDFIATYMNKSCEKLVFKCSSLLIHRQKIATHILTYALDASFKKKFLLSLSKIYCQYIDFLLSSDIKHKANDLVCIKFAAYDKAIPIYPLVVYGIILVLSYCDNVRSNYIDRLSELFFTEPYPQIFNDFDLKMQQPLIPEWLILRLLCTQSNEIIGIVLANIKCVHIISFLEFYGLSNIALQRMLQTLDKPNAAESRMIKSLNFDREKLLNTIQIYWDRGINYGYKFAKSYLDYKSDVAENKDIEMKYDPHSKSNDHKITTELKVDLFKKDDIQKLFKEKAFHTKITFLTRQITNELSDSNLKTKKITKLFLNEFNANIRNIGDYIANGSFNSIFNLIIILVLKDSKHFGLNSDFLSIKKSLIFLELSDVVIEKTSFWKCFERFFFKDTHKGKKSKNQKKKSNLLKSSEDLDLFLSKLNQTSTEKTQDKSWCEILKVLAVEKFYNKDTELENSDFFLQSKIFCWKSSYFLSLLLHKSNFSTLKNCITYILSDDEDRETFNPTTVLDFLTICINSPKLWIGRDMDTQKIVKHEDVLQLNHVQVKNLINFVILEDDIRNRIDLVSRACCVNNSKIDWVVDYLQNHQMPDKEKVCSELYTRLYLIIPNVDLPLKFANNHLNLIQSLPSFIDKITNNLITSFMFVEPNTPLVSSQLFRYWELSMLKIASKHPLLFIRQLPMIPALLSGKVNLVNYEAFKSLNLLTIFRKFLNILSLLRPYLWNTTTKGLTGILNLYMNMFIAYYQLPRQKEPNSGILPLILQFIHLIDDWIKHDPDSANNWIKNFKHIFTELSLAYHEHQNVFRSIISGMPTQNQTAVIMNSQTYLNILRSNKSNQELLVSSLNDICKLSDAHPELPEYLLDEIRSLYLNPYTCELSISLTLKALQHNPRLSSTVVNTYLKCFQKEKTFVSNIALNYLSEFVLLAQDHRYLLLRKAFELAIAGNSMALSALTDSFKSLNSQIGC